MTKQELSPLEALKKISKVQVVRDYMEHEIETIETALQDFEWLKHKLNLTFLHSLSIPEDKMRVMKIMGFEYEEGR